MGRLLDRQIAFLTNRHMSFNRNVFHSNRRDLNLKINNALPRPL